MKEKKKRTLYNDTKGITLVALVVTIVLNRWRGGRKKIVKQENKRLKKMENSFII